MVTARARGKNDHSASFLLTLKQPARPPIAAHLSAEAAAVVEYEARTIFPVWEKWFCPPRK